MGAHALDEGRERRPERGFLIDDASPLLHVANLALASFPKTSGQSGMLVLVALGEGQSFETARVLAELLGKLLVDEYPDIATMDRVVARDGVDAASRGRGRRIRIVECLGAVVTGIRS